MLYFDLLLVAFFVTLFIIPIIKNYSLQAGYVDEPNERKVHELPMSRLGGIGIVTGFILSVLVVSFLYRHSMDVFIVKVLLGAVFISIIGIWDDIKGLKAPVKLIGQLLIAFFIVSDIFGPDSSIKIDFITNPFTGKFIYLNILSIPLSMLWITGIINAINLIDGLDGLAGGISVISGISLFIVSMVLGEKDSMFIIAAMIGASLGFLKYNYNPASIFMGDTGSLFLGYLLAVVSIIGVLKSTTTIALAVPILALGIPIYDTLSSIVRRLKKGDHIFKPDDEHIHHRLLDLGFSHKEVVKIIYFASITLSVGALIIGLSGGAVAIVSLFAICLVLVLGIKFIHKYLSQE